MKWKQGCSQTFGPLWASHLPVKSLRVDTLGPRSYKRETGGGRLVPQTSKCEGSDNGGDRSGSSRCTTSVFCWTCWTLRDNRITSGAPPPVPLPGGILSPAPSSFFFSLSLFSIIPCLGLCHICALTVVSHDFGGSFTSLSDSEQSSKATPVRF